MLNLLLFVLAILPTQGLRFTNSQFTPESTAKFEQNALAFVSNVIAADRPLTDEEMGVLDQIMELVESISHTNYKDHLATVAQIDRYRKALEKCNNEQNVEAVRLGDITEQQRKTHHNCRDSEAANFETFELHCNLYRQVGTTNRPPACMRNWMSFDKDMIQQSMASEPKFAAVGLWTIWYPHEGWDHGSVTAGDPWARNADGTVKFANNEAVAHNSDFYQGADSTLAKMDELIHCGELIVDTWLGGSANFVSSMVEQRGKCEWAEQTLIKQRAKCDIHQSRLDLDFCLYKQERDSSCGAHDTCVADNGKLYDDEYAAAVANSEVRKAQHISLEKVKCFVKVLGTKERDYKVRNASLTTCLELDPDTSKFDIGPKIAVDDIVCIVDTGPNEGWGVVNGNDYMTGNYPAEGKWGQIDSAQVPDPTGCGENYQNTFYYTSTGTNLWGGKVKLTKCTKCDETTYDLIHNNLETLGPTGHPTRMPSYQMDDQYTATPTWQPTPSPTKAATDTPTNYPTGFPTQTPTNFEQMSMAPTNTPTTEAPTQSPTTQPTPAPTSQAPTSAPTEAATDAPTNAP